MTDLKKVWFELPANAWHGSASETVWAQPLADDIYRIENSPFFAYGVNFQDVVGVKEDNQGRRVFREVVRRSGHSTVRVILMRGMSSQFATWWEPLEQLGCTYEENQYHALYAIDVPVDADIEQVVKLLEDGREAGVWEWEEGSLVHE